MSTIPGEFNFQSGLLLGLVWAYFVDAQRTVTMTEAWWLSGETILVKDSGGDYTLCGLINITKLPIGVENSYACFTRYPAWSLDLSTVSSDVNTSEMSAFSYARDKVESTNQKLNWLEQPLPIKLDDYKSE